MKTRRVGRWMLLGMALVGTASAQSNTSPMATAQPATHEVVARNPSGEPALRILASRLGQHQWGTNLLGEEGLPGRGEVTLTVPGDYCWYDFRIELRNGDTIRRDGINVCRQRRFSIMK